MQTVLDSAHTWFFDSLRHGIGEELIISLAEGIKGSEPLPVEISPGVVAGHHFPVQVQPQSRCAEVTFKLAKGFLVFNESFDSGDESLEADTGVLRECTAGQFLGFLDSFTSIQRLSQSAMSYYLLWTEDRLIYVANDGVPDVQILNSGPNLEIQRTSTWSAS